MQPLLQNRDTIAKQKQGKTKNLEKVERVREACQEEVQVKHYLPKAMQSCAQLETPKESNAEMTALPCPRGHSQNSSQVHRQ